MSAQDTAEVEVYFACLSSYNDGRQYGTWVDMNQDDDDIWAAVKRMLAGSPTPGAEEWEIHDTSGVPQSLFRDHGDVEKLARFARFIDDQPDEIHRLAVRAWLDDDTSRINELDQFEDAYRGHWSGVRDFVEEWVRDVGLAGIPAGANLAVVHVREGGMGFTEHGQRGTNLLDDLSRFLSWDRVAEDVMQSFTSHAAPDGGVFIFDPNA